MDFLYCKETKKLGAYYLTLGVGLTIKSETIKTRGYIRGWTLALASGEIYTGTTKEEFLQQLHTLWPDLKHTSDSTKQKVVIYTDEIRKVQGFFQKEMTASFEDLQVEIDDYFDVRPCKRWFEEEDALSIAQQAQKVIDTYFVPEKHFYLTPQQRNRKILAKTKGADTTADQSYPRNYDKYLTIRNAYFSGLLYIPFCTTITEPMIVLDITSSYIFDLLIEKHVVSKQVRVRDLSMWEYYLSSATKISLGCYKVKYATPRTFVSCYTDVDGNKLKSGEHEVTMVLTNIDLQNLLNLGYILSVEPIWLYEYEAAELPEYFREALVKAYIAKATSTTKKEKAIRKPILNGFYGDTIRRYDNDEDGIKEFWKSRENPALSPLWGICTTAYAKKYLLKLALKIDGWYYSDTDSIICKDTKQNRKLLAEFNEEIRSMVKDFCDKYGYDFNILKDLGTFKIEAEVQKLRVWTTKTYCYKKVDGEVVLKAAGLVKDNIEVDDKLFYQKELDYTRYVFPTVVKANGEEEGYYAEIKPANRAQFHIFMKQLMTTSKLKNL